MKKLLVNEIFGPTIQGEGQSIGKPVMFLRLSGCNQHCVWCLPGNTVVITKDGSKKIRDIKKDDLVLSLVGNTLSYQPVINIMKRVADRDEILEIETESKKIYATREHPFFVNNAWIEAGELSIGDELYYLNQYDYISWRMKNSNPMFDGGLADKVGKANRGRKAFFTDEHRAKISKSKLLNPTRLPGNQNPNWRGGISNTLGIGYDEWQKLRQFIFERDGCKCVICGESNDLVIHHIDYIRSNTAIDNLTVLCRICNSRLSHGRYETKAIWEGNKVLAIEIGNRIVSNGKTIKRIGGITKKQCARMGIGYRGEDGSGDYLDVYNLTVGGSHNYFANGFLTHNCDTPYTWRFSDTFPHRDGQVYDKLKESHPMDMVDVLKELLEKSNGNHVDSLVISGGEPMLQQAELKPLLNELKEVLYWDWVEIETAGTIMPDPDFVNYVDQFNISPKLSNSGNPFDLRYQPEVIEALADTGLATWKFVVSDLEDFDEIDKIVGTHGLSPVYVMPEGIDKASLLQHTYIDEIIKRGYHLTPRLHIQLWGNERGH